MHIEIMQAYSEIKVSWCYNMYSICLVKKMDSHESV